MTVTQRQGHRSTGILPVGPSGILPDANKRTGETPVRPTGKMPVLQTISLAIGAVLRQKKQL